MPFRFRKKKEEENKRNPQTLEIAKAQRLTINVQIQRRHVQPRSENKPNEVQLLGIELLLHTASRTSNQVMPGIVELLGTSELVNPP